jgi:hypothetical protein
VARRAEGRISEVFDRPAERQAAYDFVERSSVSAKQISKALGEAAARRARRHEFVFIVLDGTSLTLTDRGHTKPFGSIGPRSKGARGLKVINAYALAPNGVPLGVAAQVWWKRGKRVDKKRYRPVRGRESCYWHDAVTGVKELFAGKSTRLHVLADREADAAALMSQLHRNECDFTIRSNATRAVEFRGKKFELRKLLPKLPVVASSRVEVRANAHRRARVARLRVHSGRVVALLRDHHIKGPTHPVTLTVVWAHEVGTTPRGEKPLDWVLFTTSRVHCAADAGQVLHNYTLRWRIEDFHRTWKNGHCQVEDTQLRSADAVIKWATIHAAVAARAERLRHRAREAPDDPATTEFSPIEMDALHFLKTDEKRRNEVIPDPDEVSLALAVRWVADLGGYTGKSSGGPPGATTIGRGLERVIDAARIIAALRKAGKMR